MSSRRASANAFSDYYRCPPEFADLGTPGSLSPESGYFACSGAIGFGRLRDLTDYGAYGGAPILGFEHLLIKSHGRSHARAITNAIKVAAKAVRDGVTREIATAIQSLSRITRADRLPK